MIQVLGLWRLNCEVLYLDPLGLPNGRSANARTFPILANLMNNGGGTPLTRPPSLDDCPLRHWYSHRSGVILGGDGVF